MQLSGCSTGSGKSNPSGPEMNMGDVDRCESSESLDMVIDDGGYL